MTRAQKALLELVGIGATGECLFTEDLYEADWTEVYELVCSQSVACLAMHGLEVLHRHDVNTCPTEQKLTLYARSLQAEKAMQQKLAETSEFADLVKPLQVVALKGVDYAQFWPNPLWREFGDLDCCLAKGSGEDLDKVATEHGCKFEEGDAKHTHLFYKKLMVENHHNFTSYGTDALTQQVEKDLKMLFFNGDFKPIGNCGLLSPNINFTAVYMVTHIHGHFFYEGITLRQILDWYFFFMKEGWNVDWVIVMPVLERTGLMPFVVLLTAFCEKHFGLQPQMAQIDTDNVDAKLLKEFVDDLFAEKYNDHDRRWHKMIARMLHRYRRMWRFRELNKMSIGAAIWRTIAYSSFLHRKPTLQ